MISFGPSLTRVILEVIISLRMFAVWQKSWLIFYVTLTLWMAPIIIVVGSFSC